MSNPFVSVLMPVYNADAFLSEAIESILSQSYKDFEFIIINDGSTDESKSVILSYNDSRIKYIENEYNLQLIKTLNKGLQIAIGKYIVRMDADDISYPFRIEQQIKFLENNPDVGICGSWLRTTKGNLRKYPSSHETILYHLLKENAIGHSTVTFRKDVIEKYKLYYNEELAYVEDYEMWIRCIQFTKIYNLPEELLLYRVHDSQVSNLYSKIQEKNTIEVRLKYLERFVGNISTKDRNNLFNVMKNGSLISQSDFLHLDIFLENISNNVNSKDGKLLEYICTLWLEGLYSTEYYSPAMLPLLTRKQIYKYKLKVAIKFFIKCVLYKKNNKYKSY